MGLFDFFLKSAPTDQKPAIKWVSIGGIGARVSIKYDYNANIYYGFYNKNPYVMSVVNRIKQDVASQWVELRIWEDTTDFSPLEEMIKLWSKCTFQKFKERIMRDYEIAGNVYVYLVRNESDDVIGLQVLDPRYITPVTDESWVVLGYVQNLAGIRAFTKDEVFHLKDDTDTEDETVGKSKLSSLWLDIMSDREASESNYSFFVNNQTPSSIVVLEDTPQGAEQDTNALKKVKELFSSWNYAGGKNSNRTAFVEGLKEIIQVQQRMDDAQFLNLRKFSLEMVCAVFGVPKDIIGFTDTSNRSVGNVQTEIYYNNINTKDNIFQEFMDEIVKYVLWDEYEFVVLRDTLRILERKMKVAKEGYKEARLISLNEAREIIQYEERSDWDDVFQEKVEAKAIDEK